MGERGRRNAVCDISQGWINELGARLSMEVVFILNKITSWFWFWYWSTYLNRAGNRRYLKRLGSSVQSFSSGYLCRPAVQVQPLLLFKVLYCFHLNLLSSSSFLFKLTVFYFCPAGCLPISLIYFYKYMELKQ